MNYINSLTTKLSNIYQIDDKPVITENMRISRDILGKHICYEALAEFDTTIRHSLQQSTVLNVDIEENIKLLDALANKKQEYISLTLNMDEFTGSRHLIKDQGEPNGKLSYIATADFYITRPTLYNVTEITENGKRIIDEWKFDPKYITVGGERYLPYIVKVFTNLHNGITKACLYRINTKTLKSNVQYNLYKENYTFSTNIVLGFINIKQDNEDDFGGQLFVEQFKISSDNYNHLKNAVVDGLKIQTIQDIKTQLDKRVIKVSDDTCVDANYLCPLTVSSENLDRIIGTIIRVRNGVSFSKSKPVDIYKDDKLIGDELSNYDRNLYAWYLTYHYVSNDSIPLSFNAVYNGNNSSYYKQWNVDGEVIKKVDLSNSQKKYQDKFDSILKDKYSNIKFENIGEHISWYKDEIINDYNPIDIFIDTRSIVSVCDKSCYKELFIDENELEKFFNYYYSTLTNNVRFSHNMLITLIGLDQEYERSGFGQLIKFFEQNDSMKKRLINALIFNTKTIDLMIWLELIKKDISVESFELAVIAPEYEDLSEEFIDSIKKNDYKSIAKSFYDLLNFITTNEREVNEDLCGESTFDEEFFRRFDFDNDIKLMFNVLFENSITYGLTRPNRDQLKALQKRYEDMRDLLMKHHDFTVLLKYNIDESGITDAFDVFDCLKDLDLKQKQFIYKVLCDYY